MKEKFNTSRIDIALGAGKNINESNRIHIININNIFLIITTSPSLKYVNIICEIYGSFSSVSIDLEIVLTLPDITASAD